MDLIHSSCALEKNDVTNLHAEAGVFEFRLDEILFFTGSDDQQFCHDFPFLFISFCLAQILYADV